MVETVHNLPFLLPHPGYAMKENERRVFGAEQALLRGISEHIPPTYDATDPYSNVLLHVADLSATHMARQVAAAYGLEGVCISSGAIGKRFGVTAKTANTNRRVVLQTLYLMYPKTVALLPHADQELLTSRYAPLAQTEPSQDEVLQRARSNIGYWKDRELIWARADEILELVQRLYGSEAADLFSQMYRLGYYVEHSHHERRGAIEKLPSDPTNAQKLRDALEVGRAATEHVYEVPIGSHGWIQPKGGTQFGYQRRGIGFEKKVEIYNHYQLILQMLDQNGHDLLLPLEYELLACVANAVLDGQNKIDGVREFNARYNSSYSQQSALRAEQKLMGESKGDSAYWTQVNQWLQDVVQNARHMEALITQLADISFNFHVAGMTHEQIAQDVELSEWSVGQLKRLMDKLIMAQLDRGEPTSQIRGHITTQMIDHCVVESEKHIEESVAPLVLTVSRILERMQEVDSLSQLVEELSPYNIKLHELESLRTVAISLVHKTE